MQLNEYIQLALRTESVPESLNINRITTEALCQLFVEVGKLADGLKRSIYYKNDERLNKNFVHHLHEIVALSTQLLRASSMEQYPSDVFKSKVGLTNVSPRLFHGVIGIASEAGELVEAIIPAIKDEENSIDRYNIQEEMGDGAGGTNSWYAAILHDELGLDPVETMTKNLNKLRVRFPEKYSDELAANRNLNDERQILEGEPANLVSPHTEFTITYHDRNGNRVTPEEFEKLCNP